MGAVGILKGLIIIHSFLFSECSWMIVIGTELWITQTELPTTTPHPTPPPFEYSIIASWHCMQYERLLRQQTCELFRLLHEPMYFQLQQRLHRLQKLLKKFSAFGQKFKRCRTIGTGLQNWSDWKIQMFFDVRCSCLIQRCPTDISLRCLMNRAKTKPRYYATKDRPANIKVRNHKRSQEICF